MQIEEVKRGSGISIHFELVNDTTLANKPKHQFNAKSSFAFSHLIFQHFNYRFFSISHLSRRQQLTLETPTDSQLLHTALPNGIRIATEKQPGHFVGVGMYINAGLRHRLFTLKVLQDDATLSFRIA